MTSCTVVFTLVHLIVITAKWIDTYNGGESVGHRDPNGVRIAGSSVGQLETHKGRLFASNNYFMDSSSGMVAEFQAGLWGQVLRKDGPNAPWTVDLELGAYHIRCETLTSVTFKTNGTGHALIPPVTLLVAATFGAPDVPVDRLGISVFVRNDTTDMWTRRVIFSAPRPKNPEDMSIRAILGHTDSISGISMIFISLGLHGIISGVYNSLAQQIEWKQKPESPQVDERSLAIAVANNKLYFSGGMKIFRRIDGENPSYTLAHDASDLASFGTFSSFGGLRGLSPIVDPGRRGRGESILFSVQALAGNPADGCIYRIDLNPVTGDVTKRTQEMCLSGKGSPLGKYLGGAPVFYAFAAYNGMVGFYPLSRNKKDSVHMFGLQAYTDGRHGLPIWAGRGNLSGLYRGGLFCVRKMRGSFNAPRYTCKEVAGPSTFKNPPKVAVVTYIRSPFKSEEGTLYVGGHDINPMFGVWSDSHAWISKGHIKGDVLPRLGVRPQLVLPSVRSSHGMWGLFGWSSDPWFDAATRLEWTNGRGLDRNGAAPTLCTWTGASTGCYMPVFSAAAFCKNNKYLVQAGRYPGERWRLPSISELRSFVRACPNTSYHHNCGELNCNINSVDPCESNSTAVSQKNQLCDGCSTFQGPDDGCYWSLRTAGRCSMYVSSTIASDNPGRVWALNQQNGKVLSVSIFEPLDIRCVRGHFAYE